ncbi:non-ribosomal peptide synthetase [Rhodococcus sp. ABRD24]|uniref:non-ribosomal peptide synthetase n=1 Tax=Rhodococcus sp. ABRD24 TaxID=2507582 RepID=UPI00103B2CEA|nr:non-ribosomal peptide synthetase [Rhodococcus sp. ABRD24]QBJ95977.1 non-ribosomal peptide synthetase [Rhodococcus sp. ABRD24]
MRPFPLSSAQRALLLAQQLSPQVPLTISYFVELRGEVDCDAVMAACEQAARELESATIVLVETDRGTEQMPVPDIEDAPAFLDLTGAADPEAAARRWMAERYTRPIDPLRDRLIAATLIRLREGHHYIYGHAHHIVLDGYGADVMTQRIAETYTCRVRGLELSPLHAIPLEKLAESEAEYRGSRREALDRAYWLDRLAALPPVVSLADRAGPLAVPARLAAEALPGDLADVLSRQGPDVPVVVAAFAAYLARVSGARDIALSLPVSARTTAALRHSAGSVSNVVPLVVHLDPSDTVDDLVRRVQLELTGALRHQRFRYDAMLQAMPDSDGRGSVGGVFGPVVNVMQFSRELRFGDVVGEMSILSTGPVDDLSLTVYPGVAGRSTRVDFEANPSRYTDAALGRHHSRFLAFLAEFAAHRSSPVQDLSFGVPGEMDGLLPAEGRAGHGAVLLPEALTRHASSERVALRSGDTEITYTDLDARSSALARRLIALGAGPETRVAVALPRSVESVLALWAVAKTGAAYVPVDPELPSSRLAQHLDGVTVALSHAETVLPQDIARICVEWDEWDRSDGTPVTDADRLRPVRLDNPAWIVHTSGSTGQPKGVVVGHGGLGPLISTLRSRYAATADSRVLHLASPTFDASLQEILLAADAGATLVIAAPDIAGGERLRSFLEAESVTHFISAPAVLATMPPESLPHLTMLDAGGEVLPVPVARRWSHGRTMVNAYGPTETTILATVSAPLEGAALDAAVSVPIGRPVDAASVAVLDSRLRAVPPGVTGELYVAGPALARGYAGRPGQTAERFVASVFGAGRMYRTGDLVRWGDDGQLVFVGRADHQVQVRGVRIELGDIEYALDEHPGITGSAVVVVDGRLVAYVHGTVQSGVIRDWLVDRLPRQMVPDSIVPLDALPLTPSGKIDRTALAAVPVPDTSGPGRALHGPVELAIADAIRTVLGSEQVDASSDFFALGGDSLTASLLAARISSTIGRRVQVRDVFVHRTVADLATAAIGRGTRPALEWTGVEEAPLAPAQQRLWLHARTRRTSTAYHVPFAVELEGDLPVAALQEAIRDVLGRHAVLRSIIRETALGPLQTVLPVDAAFTGLVVQETDSDEQSSREAVAFAAEPFGLETGAPIRFRLHRLAADRHVLVIVAHHIAMDGLSFVPLLRDLAAACRARWAGEAPAWPALPVQYIDYALWHRSLLRSVPDAVAGSSVEDQELAYWGRVLAGAAAVPGLPADRPRTSTPGAPARVSFAFDAELREALGRLARDHDATTFMVLHAALAVVIAAVTGTPDTVVGAVTAGRSDPALDPLVGMFVGTVALRTAVGVGQSFADLLATTRVTDIDAFAHSDTPFERVLEHVGGQLPLQVVLAYESFVDPTVDLPGLVVRGRELPATEARFDLELVVRELPGAGFEGHFAFDTGLFDRSTVSGWLTLLRNVLRAAVADPTATVADLVAGQSAAANPQPCEAETLPEIADGPIRVADPDGGVADIRPRAAALAAHLRERGIGTEDFVGILLPRSVESFTAAIAVAYAGAAFVPLDPGQPTQRTAAILGDAGVRYVIAADNAPLPAGVVRIDPAVGDDARTPTREAIVRPHPDNPAYVIYTSGSTGAPKGVVVTHRGLSPLASALRRTFGVGAGSRVLLGAAPAFDASILEYLLVLGTGATAVVVPAEIYGGEDLADFVRAQRITHWFSTPAVPAQLDASGFDDLRVLGMGGEAWPPDLAARWAGGRTVLNLYGPTEATVAVTVSRPLDAAGAVPIGDAIEATSAAVLDADLRPVPTGVVGELYVAGPGLARGYLGRPGHTGERFVASVLGPGRMYRTGDLVRRRADGQLEFVGRADQQVQIRGFRVELGEVEAALATHPDVDTAVVVAHDGALAAYVHGSGALEPDAVRGFVADRLPRYMVPASVTVLDEVPLTATGKVDRFALPRPAAAPSGDGAVFRSPVEELVGRVTADLFSLPAVGPDTDFFAIGGNSLLATQLVSRLGKALGRRLDVRDVFEHPTVAGLAAVLADRAPDERPAITAATQPGPAPLSPAQQRMWLLGRADRGGTDNVAFAIDLDGHLDVSALTVAVLDVLERHAVLRTVFPETPEGPVQVTQAASVDLTPVDAPENLDEVLRAAASAPFDLTVEQPIRLRLYRVSDDRHTVSVVAHHIALDGLSLLPLTRDFTDAYRAREAGQAPGWSPLVIQYTDYARWHRAVLGEPADPGSRARRDLDYWRSALDGAPPLLTLPTDRSRHLDADTGTAATVDFSMTPDLRDAVDKVAREYDSTPFMVIHAALAVLLAKLAGTDDVSIGTPVSGRVDPVVDDVVGMFVGTVVLRNSIDPRWSFAELLGEVRRTDIAAFSHTELPFDEIVAELAPTRTVAHHPLFQVMFSHENFVPTVFELPGLVVRGRELFTGHTRFDLELAVRERDPGGAGAGDLDGRLTYARDLFDHDTVTRWAQWFVQVLTLVADDPAVTIDRIDPAALHVPGGRPVRRSLAAAATDAAAQSLGELFALRAREFPGNIAVVAGEERLTYAELDARSGALAALLVAQGVGAEDLVAVALPRSAQLIVAVLAVARAGATLLPLEVTQPVDRLSRLIDDARPACVICIGGFDSSATIVDLADADVRARLGRGGRHDSAVRAGQAAYVVYTSGSTGTPKGVMVSHASVLALLANTCPGFGFGPSDVWSMFHSPAFDFSVWEIWGPLTTGGRVVVVDHLAARSPAEFRDILVREGVTVLNQTPTAFQQLAEITDGTDSTGELAVRLLVFGGEALEAHRVRDWLERHPAVRAVNMFGITETTVHATCAEVGSDPAGRSDIGTALPGVRVDLLDGSLRPVLPGAVGEMYISGLQVARGYHGRPELTAQRFVAAPHGGVMYRTGDLARLRNDGGLEYRGRADDQIQLRGYRIEPGEIRAALTRLPGISAAVVAVRRERLVGYVVLDAGHDGTADGTALIRALRGMLPDYMVPAAIVTVPALPLTANGKLDGSVLPDAEPADRFGPEPRRPLDDLVADAFRELLGVHRIGSDDDFFELGGHSLLATQLAGRISALTDASIGVRDVFEAATVSDLARVVEERIGGPRLRSRLTASEGPAPERGPLSPAQRRLWFLHRFDPESTAHNLPFVVHLDGSLDVVALAAAARDVLERHRTLRTVYPSDVSGPVQVVAEVPELDLTPVAVPATALDDFVAAFAATPFVLASEPPVRSRLYRIGARRHALVFVVHHIAADEWSLAPMLRDMADAYRARSAGIAPSWPALPVEYIDYAAWHVSNADQDVQSWLDVLDGLPEQSTLPHDHPVPAAGSSQADSVRISLDAALATGIGAVARQHRATAFMVLHAALAAALSRHNGSRDIPIGTVVAGRGDPRLDEVVGMFASTLVLRAQVAPDASFAELLEHVRGRDLAAYTHSETPFETLVERLAPVRDSSHHPLFQVALSMRRPMLPSIDLPGLVVTAAAASVETTHFDLQLTVTETPAGIELEFTYKRDLYERATIAAFASRFVALLDEVVRDPAAEVGRIDLLTDGERAALVPARGGASAPASLWSLLSGGAAIDGGAVAVVAGGETLTYHELRTHAEALAAVLCSRGAVPGVAVACALPRSLESVVAVWAIARTGAAPVMIDPAHPVARIETMLRTSGAVIGVSSADRLGGLPAVTGWVDVAAAPGEAVGVPAAPDVLPGQPAYVVFTSGTTGRPKGVIVTSLGLGALAQDLRELFAAGPGSRMLHLAAPGFDAALLEILVAGASGAELVVAPENAYGGEELARVLEDQRITHACMTPSALATVPVRELPDLAVLMLGGERVQPELVQRWAPGRRLYNGYGPAESTVFATCSAPLRPGHPAVIGSPARGIDALVLDACLRPVPTGVTGELYLAGQRMAAGYAGAPARTAERFVAGPDGTRWYRTGDLVRWVDGPSGLVLDFRGRNDEQVKLRGIRIEPGEIDAVLGGVPGVEHAVTVLRQSARRAALVSYVVPKSLDPAAVRRALAAQLPSYMVPSSLVLLDALPRTENGKLDMRHLPVPELPDTSAEPATPTERIVADAFSAVLGVEVGGTDDFFTAGGDSLLATTVVARLRESTGQDLPLRLLFADPTVSGLAAALDAGDFAESEAGPVSAPRPARIPLSRAQNRLWALRRTGRDSDYRLSAQVTLRGPLDTGALAAALADVVDRHEALRSGVVTDERGPHLVIADGTTAGASGIFSAQLRPESPDVHVLDVTIDHLAADGESVAVLLRDLGAAYGARVAGAAPEWSPLPLQYADFAVWERGREVSADDVEHWRRELLDFDPAVLPMDSVPDAQIGAAESIEFTIAPDVARSLGDLARRHRATEFMVAHAALAAVLARLTASGDVGIAAVVSGRRFPQLEPLVGLFLDTLVLRARVQPDMPFAGLLAQVRDTDVAAFDHAGVPLEEVLSAAGLRVPQVALAFQDFTPPVLRMGDLEVQARETGSGTAKFDLQFTLSGSASDGLDGVLTYDVSRFESATALALVDHFVAALAAVADRPDVAVRDLPLATAAVRTGGRAAEPRTLAELLRETAAAHPDRIAVVAEETSVTYRELDAQSDALAERLIREEGYAAEDVVALDRARSLDRLRMLWAVAKTGAAFGPAGLPSGLAGGRRQSVDSIAYVIATSGSSGEPKLVAVTHRGLAALAAEARHRYRVEPGDRVLHGYNPAFDAAMLEILLAHTSGATLVVAPPDVYAGPALHELLRERRVTHFLSTPAVLATLGPVGLDELRVVASGGETLPAELAARWRTGRLMLDAYGPTESTIVATVGEVDGRGGIGTPIPGTTVLVLDGELRPVPVGGVGELYLAGDGLARGYLGAPALTAERFVASGTGRMYRTGDRVQVHADGRLIYRGRNDRQLKVRGVRVEPGHVEAALMRGTGVRNAAALVRGGALIAFVVGEDIDTSACSAELRDRLPLELIPSKLIVLESIPTTPNGKVDVAALSATAGELAVGPAGRAMTAVEQLVVTVVGDVLGAAVDPDSGFFALGGHSLSAVEVAGRLSGALHRDVPARAVLEAPTLAALAEQLSGPSTLRPQLGPAAPGPDPMAPAQRRLWLLHRADPVRDMYAMPIVLRLAGDLDADALAAAFRDVAERHAALRTIFPDERSQRVVEVGDVEIAVDPAPSSELDRRVRAVLDRPLDLVGSPPVRVSLLRVSDTEWLLVAVVHHIAVDGASIAPLLQDVSVAYTARRAGDAPEWTALPLQYRDFAHWQVRALGDLDDPESIGGRQLAYWTEVLAGTPDTPLPLPTDRPRPAQPSHRGGLAHADIGPDVHAALRALARAHGVSVFMVLHAGLAVLLSRFAGRSDIAIGTVVNGRSDNRLAALAGMFVGTVALRTQIDPAESFAELLERVRGVDLGAFAHADVPFDDVVARVAPARSPAHHPIFQVLLAHSVGVPGQLVLPGLEIDDHASGASGQSEVAAQFDLAWDVVESSGGAGIGVRLLYATDLFDGAAAEDLLTAWIDLLAHAVAGPSTAVGDLPLGSPDAALHGIDAPQARTLPEILAASVRAHPERIALRAGAEQWTYAELDAAAAVRAAQLQSAGIGAGDIVPVDAVRGPAWVLDIWAITRIGAAWVPIDPSQPDERKRLLLEDSGRRRVPETAAGVDALAYLLYTSGSTGTPKGVAVTHRGLSALVDLQTRELGVTHESVVLQAASPAFDAAVFELLAAHAHGAVLVCRPDLAYAGPDLQAVIVGDAITHLNLTPTVLATLDPDSMPRALTVVSAGEVLPDTLARAWARHRLHNGYGPTEVTVGATCSPRLGDGPVTIGTPLAGVRAQVLDSRLHPVPAGVVGELYLDGDGLARGYHRQPGLTASRFVADPGGRPGARVYRTGDLVRRRRDGSLDYVGRSDEQVQIHGVRVEPGEIDAAFAADADVQSAVTVAHPVPSGDVILVTYVQAIPGRRIDAGALRARTGRLLPRHLLPSSVHVLDELPLTISGKVDRRSLPAPVLESARASDAPPEGPVEQSIAAAMAEVVGMDAAATVPRDVSFFELGGTSMSAVRLATTLRDEYGYAVELGWLFTDTTVAALARRIEQGAVAADPLATLVHLNTPAKAVGEPLFCVHPLSGIAWCYAGLADRLADRQLYGLQATGAATLPASLAELATAYLDEIRAVQPEGPYHLLGWSLGGNIAHEIAVQLRACGAEVATLAMLDSRPPDVVERDMLAAGENAPEDFDGLDSDAVRRVMAAGEALEAAAHAHRPEIFHGDALLFVAEREPGGGRELAGSWERYITGTISETPIPCSHAQMCGPEVLRRVGEVLVESTGEDP